MTTKLSQYASMVIKKAPQSKLTLQSSQNPSTDTHEMKISKDTVTLDGALQAKMLSLTNELEQRNKEIARLSKNYP